MKMDEAPVETAMAQNQTPNDPTRLAALREQLLREASVAERYGHWAQSARLHAQARDLERQLRSGERQLA